MIDCIIDHGNKIKRLKISFSTQDYFLIEKKKKIRILSAKIIFLLITCIYLSIESIKIDIFLETKFHEEECK